MAIRLIFRKHLDFFRPRVRLSIGMVEAVGIEPTSEKPSSRESHVRLW